MSLGVARIMRGLRANVNLDGGSQVAVNAHLADVRAVVGPVLSRSGKPRGITRRKRRGFRIARCGPRNRDKRSDRRSGVAEYDSYRSPASLCGRGQELFVRLDQFSRPTVPR